MKHLEEMGFSHDKVHRNLSVPKLVEETLRRGEGWLASNGALVIRTGPRTGRSPMDRFFVEEPSTKNKLWWGKVNQPVDSDVFDRLLKRTLSYLHELDVYVFDGFVGADSEYRMPVRVIAERPCLSDRPRKNSKPSSHNLQL
jgi:phosphoenolpyruvate carboxykinase (ATP)